MDQKIDAFQDRFLKRCWWILGGKMEASWHQNRSKIDACCETWVFEKSCSPYSGGSIFQDSGVQVGSQNRSNIDQKMKPRWEGILESIFHRFWWIWGGKLAPKIKARSIKKGIEKTNKKRRAPRCQKSRNKRHQPPRPPGVQDPGEVPPL